MKRAQAQLGPKHLAILADRGPGVRVVSGGYGSAKTSLGFAFVVDLGLRHGELGPILGTEPSYPMVRDVMEQTAIKFLDMWRLPYRHWKADHIFEIGGRKRFEFWCRSLDRPRSVEGVNAIGYWGDEWELCDVDALIPAMQRVRVGEALEIMLTGTPEGFGAPYDLVLANRSPTTREYIISMQDNPFLPSSYVEESERRLGTESLIAEKIHGVRMAKGGRVYGRFDRQINTSPVVEPGKGVIQIGCDFNVRFMHWVIAETDLEGRRAHIVGEVIKEGGTTTDEHAERVAEWIAAYMSRTRGRHYDRTDVYRMKIKAFIDASGSSLRTTSSFSDFMLLTQAGFRPICDKANPPVRERINTVNVLFRDRRVSVDVAACPILAKGLETQALDKNGEPEKKGNNLDHGLDALGYLAWHQWPVHRRPGVDVVTPRASDEWGFV